MEMNHGAIREILAVWASIMQENKERLIELDSVMGDGDLGLTMSDGFAAAAEAVRQSDEKDMGKLLYAAGKSMGSAVPSTMGTLMAAGLMSAGKSLKGKTEGGLDCLALMMRAYTDGIAKLGKAKQGEKTILDVLIPGSRELETAAQKGESVAQALRVAEKAAEEGLKVTTDMAAVHGRAAIRGEGSRGVQDPGATAGYLLFAGIAAWCSRK